ncbi:MAG: HAD family hydrolase [Proteobacteria bacterium]|nr:HAD family hydrolase [Pseudomonadota bacterium]
MTRRYAHIIWDWNGTLFDDVELSVAIDNELLGQFGKPQITLEQYRACFDLPVKGFYERLGFSFAPDSAVTFERVMTAFWDAYESRQRDECQLHDNVTEILWSCREAGYKQSLLSSLPHRQLTEAVTRFGLGELFATVSGHPDDQAGSKLERGRTLMTELGLESDSVVLVGDTTHDFDVARALGIEAILVANGHQSATLLRQKTSRVVESVASVDCYLGRR